MFSLHIVFQIHWIFLLAYIAAKGRAVGHVIVAQRYKSEGRGFDSVIGIFHSHNPSGHIMALKSIQPLTEVNNSSISPGWGHWIFLLAYIAASDRLCGLVVRVSGYRYRGLGFDSRRYQIF